MSLGRHVTLNRYDNDSTAPDKMEKIGDVIELSGIEITSDVHEDTPYGGDESSYRTYSYGLKDGGEMSLTARYKNAASQVQIQGLVDAQQNDIIEKVQLVFPAPINEKVTVSVLVTKVGHPTAEKGGRLNRDITLKVSGEPLWESV